ncbi:MAG TPA: CopL family metal-binding regulatory protein [Candidatus Limnocylindria bacterium]
MRILLCLALVLDGVSPALAHSGNGQAHAAVVTAQPAPGQVAPCHESSEGPSHGARGVSHAGDHDAGASPAEADSEAAHDTAEKNCCESHSCDCAAGSPAAPGSGFGDAVRLERGPVAHTGSTDHPSLYSHPPHPPPIA